VQVICGRNVHIADSEGIGYPRPGLRSVRGHPLKRAILYEIMISPGRPHQVYEQGSSVHKPTVGPLKCRNATNRCDEHGGRINIIRVTALLLRCRVPVAEDNRGI
jgi:hypothetical protein